MPKVSYSKSKGLKQATGTGFEVKEVHLKASGGLALGVERVTGAGALSTSVPVSLIDTTGGACAITLAAADNNFPGAIKTIVMVKDAGNAVLTIAASAFAGASNTYTFTDVGQTLTLMHVQDEDGTAVGWAEISRGSGANAGATAVAGLAAASTV